MFFRLNLFDYSIKRQIYNPSKIYSIDPALSNSIAFKFSRNIGHIYENLVFVELKRRDKDIFYWKSKRQKEVDFVVREGTGIKQLIQVCFNVDNVATRKREVSSLLEGCGCLKCSDLLIITDDYAAEEKVENNKIKFVPLWKWLLAE